MAYGSAAQLRAHIDKNDPADDATLVEILNAATANIDRACNRYLPDLTYFEAPVVASARTYAGSGKGHQRINPCVEITLVEVKESYTDTAYTAWVPADWVAYCGSYERPNFNDLPYTAVMVDPNGDYCTFTKSPSIATVRVTARWGYSDTPPPDIMEACVMQSARWYKRLQSAMSDTLASGELGMLLYRQSLDPDIRRILVDGRYINAITYGF